MKKFIATIMVCITVMLTACSVSGNSVEILTEKINEVMVLEFNGVKVDLTTEKAEQIMSFITKIEKEEPTIKNDADTRHITFKGNDELSNILLFYGGEYLSINNENYKLDSEEYNLLKEIVSEFVNESISMRNAEFEEKVMQYNHIAKDGNIRKDGDFIEEEYTVIGAELLTDCLNIRAWLVEHDTTLQNFENPDIQLVKGRDFNGVTRIESIDFYNREGNYYAVVKELSGVGNYNVYLIPEDTYTAVLNIA